MLAQLAGLIAALGLVAARYPHAGTAPADAVNPVAVQAMREVGIDISGGLPKKLDDDSARDCDVIITMGCGDACPYVPGKR